jgi:hypothetical protein
MVVCARWRWKAESATNLRLDPLKGRRRFRKMNQQREMELDLPLPAAKGHAFSALEKLGKVTAFEEDFIAGRVSFGLEGVDVRVSWADTPGGTRLVLQASGGDMCGTAAKSAVERLETAIRNVETPGFQVDRAGVSPATMFSWFVVWLVLLVLLGPRVTTLLFGN